MGQTTAYKLGTEGFADEKKCVPNHDNVPSHTSLVTTEVLANFNVATLPQAPYSPDLTPSDFFMFLRIEKDLKENQFDTIPVIQIASTRSLNSLACEDFHEAYEQ